MKKILLFISVLITFSSCKDDNKTESSKSQLTPAEKIAQAHGLENWKDVKEIRFTFNVERDTSHFERSWIWEPKTDNVIMVSGLDTIQYNRKNVDSLSLNADKAFVNDKYWLLAPFQLTWDTNATLSDTVTEQAPISQKMLHKITLSYPSDGGYTPGDAYDFYYDDNYVVREWNYRKGNSQEPTLSCTWENYKDFNGIKIAQDHQRSGAVWRLHFTDIEITD